MDAGARLDLMTDPTVTGSAGKITFRALNPAIATVDANGVVTAVSDGLAYFEIACGTVKTVAAVSVRNTPHTHSFTRALPLAEYLAGDATCTEPARYYYICSCGGVGTNTYAYGEAKGHVFGEWTLNLADNTCERICSVCGEAEKDNSMSLLSVSGSMARAGDTVRITVSLANNPGIAALAFRISYPKGAMTLESAVAGELFGNATRNPSAGLFLFDNATDVTENGTLPTLTFKVSDTAALGEYRIALEIVSCNNASEETILLCGGQANIPIRDVLPGDVNGDGVVDTLDITKAPPVPCRGGCRNIPGGRHDRGRIRNARGSGVPAQVSCRNRHGTWCITRWNMKRLLTGIPSSPLTLSLGVTAYAATPPRWRRQRRRLIREIP